VVAWAGVFEEPGTTVAELRSLLATSAAASAEPVLLMTSSDWLRRRPK
jgi:hypothetical protein